MPNHVTNKITFDQEHAIRVFGEVCYGDYFDFERLIPSPPQKYAGDLGRDDDEDFKCNWSTWNCANWGTKWNAYDCSMGVNDGRAWIQFDTAWSVPYPVLAAFNNRFQIPFEHRYYDEGANFWGVETWGPREYPKDDPKIVRITKRKSDEADRHALCMELKGYDPAEREDAA
jgi:hypothetical protein